ncbi:MAG TPA: glycosyltransferase family 4 protein [Phycisphaerae bacterium]
MRIALITSQWPGVRLGGIGAYTVHCARALAQAGHEVHVFTTTLPADAVVPEGVEVHQVASLAEYGMAGKMPAAWAYAVRDGGDAMYRLLTGVLISEEVRRVHGRWPLDVIEVPEYEALGLPLVVTRIAKGTGHVPVVTQLHSGSAIAREVMGAAAAEDDAMREGLELAQMLRSDGLCAPSRAVVGDTHRAYGSLGVALDAEVMGLPFGAPVGDFVPPADGAAVLFVGRLEYLKGAHLLAEAAAIFLAKFPEARLRIAGPDTMLTPPPPQPGSGSMEAWMRKRLADAGMDIAARVTFLGEQSRQGLEGELRRCAFVVVPSVRESYSYVCCEALAAGRGVVVSDQIGATEVVGEAGISFCRGDSAALADAMCEMWGDGAFRLGLSKAAYARARGALSAEAVIAQRVAFYQDVIRGADEGRPRRVNVPASITARVTKAFAAISGDEPLPAREGPKSPGTRLAEILARHQAEYRGQEGGVGFHLYGAGRHTLRLMVERTLWEIHGHRAMGIIDDHPRFAGGGEVLGLPVQSSAEAEKRLAAGDVVVLSTDAIEDQFWRQTEPLRGKGVVVYRLYG